MFFLGWHRSKSAMQVAFAVAAVLAFCFCLALTGCLNEATETSPDYLVLDDSEYPYADLPRVVIETENFAEIRDRETVFPSHLQVYGETSPISEVLELTVRGRGNSSFKMPKYGMKLEFTDKVSMFGMPANRDWALIANYGDKTHLRNYMMTRLSEWLGASYTPRMKFVELYLNRKYMGLYLFAETVKVAKNRVNIAESDTSFLVEKESSKKLDSPYVISSMGHAFHVKSPRDLKPESATLLVSHLTEFENFMTGFDNGGKDRMDEWVDMDDFLLYYWVQEFSKNEDGNFARSIFFTWKKDGLIRFGPLWDFDISFGNESYEQNRNPDKWYIRNFRWFSYIFKDKAVVAEAKAYWKRNRDIFRALADSVPVYEKIISRALDNEYKRWPIMQNTENWALKDPYKDYDEAIETMVEWMNSRYKWIDNALK